LEFLCVVIVVNYYGIFIYASKKKAIIKNCVLTDRCSGQESSRPWPDIKALSGPGLSVTIKAPWPELNVTGPGLFVSGLESSSPGQEYLLLRSTNETKL